MAVAAMFTACQEEPLVPEFIQESASDYIASIEDFGAATKTSMTETNRVVWNAGDELMIFQGYTLGDRYKVSDASAGTSNGTFSIVKGEGGVKDGDYVAGTELSRNVAVYPYSEDLVIDNVLDEDTGKPIAYLLEGIEIPAVQYYQENSFANGAFPMVAVTVDKPDRRLKFNNAAGALKLKLKGIDKVKSIKVEGNNGEKLSGKASVTAWFEDGKKPTLEMAEDAGTAVTLDCGEGVQLSLTEATSFVIALPPTEFTEGFTITITDTEGNVETKSATAANTVNRSGILAMPEIYLKYVVLDKFIYSHFSPGGVCYDNGAVCCFLVDASLEVAGGFITSGSGDYLKFDIYSENGEISLGTYYPCEEKNVIRKGTFAIGWDANEMYDDSYDDLYDQEQLQNWGTCWMNMGEDGHETGQHISDGKLTIEKAGDEYLIIIESSVVNAVYQGPLDALVVNPDQSEEVEIFTKSLSVNDWPYDYYSEIVLQLSTEGVSYDIDQTTGTEKYHGTGKVWNLTIYAEKDEHGQIYIPTGRYEAEDGVEPFTWHVAGGVPEYDMYWGTYMYDVLDGQTNMIGLTEGVIWVGAKDGEYIINYESDNHKFRYIGAIDGISTPDDDDGGYISYPVSVTLDECGSLQNYAENVEMYLYNSDSDPRLFFIAHPVRMINFAEITR